MQESSELALSIWWYRYLRLSFSVAQDGEDTTESRQVLVDKLGLSFNVETLLVFVRLLFGPSLRSRNEEIGGWSI